MNLERDLVSIDLETTGVDTTQDRIVDIAVIRLSVDGVRSSNSRKLNPTVRISKEATAVHGITDEDVAANRARGAPPPAVEDTGDGEDVIDDEGEDMEDFDADTDAAEASVTATTHDDDPPEATNTDDAIAADNVPPDPKPA